MQQRNRISSTPETESPESSSKRTQLLINYFVWLKIAGLYYASNEKTDSICKRVIFAILLALNVLFYIGIAALSLFVLIVVPAKPENETLSLTVLIVCVISAIVRLVLFGFLKKYFSVFSGHLLRSVSKQSQQPEDQQTKCVYFKFRWSIVVVVIPLAVIVALFAYGIANAVLSDWESRSYIIMKLGFHILIHQMVLQQVAILFVFTGSCYYCCCLLKNISASFKNFSTLEGEHLGLSIRSFCDVYSDFIVLMDEFTSMVSPVIVVLVVSLGTCLLVGISFFDNQVDIFEMCEIGIVIIVGICALIIIFLTFYILVNDKGECELYLLSIKLSDLLAEFKTDLCIFQGRMFQPLANDLKIFAALLTGAVTFLLNKRFNFI